MENVRKIMHVTSLQNIKREILAMINKKKRKVAKEKSICCNRKTFIPEDLTVSSTINFLPFGKRSLIFQFTPGKYSSNYMREILNSHFIMISKSKILIIP